MQSCSNRHEAPGIFTAFLHKRIGAKLFKLSPLIVIPAFLQASFSFYCIVEGRNETAAVWWSPTSGILGLPQKENKSECLCVWGFFWFVFVKK